MKHSNPPSKRKQQSDVEFSKEKNSILREAFQQMYSQQGTKQKEQKSDHELK